MLSNVIFDKVWHFELRNSLILKRQLFIVFIENQLFTFNLIAFNMFF